MTKLRVRPWLAGASALGLLSLFSVTTIPAQAASAFPLLLPAKANLVSPKSLQASQPVGPVSSSSNWTFGVVLPSSNASGLAQYDQEVSDPSSPNYQHFLTHAQMMSLYGPSAQLASQVTQYLDGRGFKVSQDGQMLNVTGPVSTINGLFSTHLERYSHNRHQFVAPNGPVSIPSMLQQAEGITGLVVNTALPQLAGNLTPASKMPMVTYAPQSAMKPAPSGNTNSNTTGGMTVTAKLISNGVREPGMAVRYLITVTDDGVPDTTAGYAALSGPYQGAEFPVDSTVTNAAGQFILDFTVSEAQQVSLALTVEDGNGNTGTVQLPTANFVGHDVATTSAASLFGSAASGTIIAPWNPASNSVVEALHGTALEQQTTLHGPADLAVYTAADVANLSQQDVDQFAQQFGLKPPNVSVAYLGPNACTASNSECTPYMFDYQAELSLDMQMMETAAPGSNIQVYEAGSLRSALNQVVAQDTARVFSLSYGTGELVEEAYAPGAQSTWDTLAEEANVEGITISVSAGDSGAYEGAESDVLTPMPSYPANSPFVSSLGGTEVSVSPQGVVNQTAMWGGDLGSEVSTPVLLSFLEEENMMAGGGYSTLERAPWYQMGFVPAGEGRGNPDFSLPASVITPGYFVYIGGTAYYVGGTSASAPLFAGFMADLGLALGHGLGNVNPLIYHLDAIDASVMMPVSYGNNGVYSVSPSYNAATGLGQVNMGQLYQDVVPAGPVPTPGPGPGPQPGPQPGGPGGVGGPNPGNGR